MARDGLATLALSVVVSLVLGVVVGSVIGYVVAPKPSSVSGASHTIFISGMSVQLAVAGGPMPDMFHFVIGGILNATVVVQEGANVTVHFINIDTDMHHSMVIVSQAPPYAATPDVQPAFPGSGMSNATVGIPPGANATFSFIATVSGTYWYLCDVPDHAASGMYGEFIVEG